MKSVYPLARAAIMVLIGLGASWASVAEVQVSITISGPADELIPVLQLLQDAGIGGESSPDVRVHSVFESAESKAAAGEKEPAEAPAPAAPVDAETMKDIPKAPSIQGASVQPASAKAGGSLTLAVELADPTGNVDTLAATVGEATGLSFDLYDDGTHGDSEPGDGTWTYQLNLPAGMASGKQSIHIVAFDAYGDPVMVGEGDAAKPLETEVSFEVAAAGNGG